MASFLGYGIVTVCDPNVEADR